MTVGLAFFQVAIKNHSFKGTGIQLCFHFVGWTKEVSNLIILINHPVVNLFGTRVGGTSAKVVPQ
jgi:hypothetical protein